MGEQREAARAIVFFDGECGLCSRAVRFLMNRDRQARLHFAPLQGETAAALLDPEQIKMLSTAIYLDREGQTHLRSDAILHALIDIGRTWHLLARPALGLPRSWRDAAYDWVAQRRHRFFPKNSCPLTTAEESERLLP